MVNRPYLRSIFAALWGVCGTFLWLVAQSSDSDSLMVVFMIVFLPAYLLFLGIQLFLFFFLSMANIFVQLVTGEGSYRGLPFNIDIPLLYFSCLAQGVLMVLTDQFIRNFFSRSRAPG